MAYEYLITLGDEVELFWGKRFTGASLLFFLNRYLNIFQTAWTIAVQIITTYIVPT